MSTHENSGNGLLRGPSYISSLGCGDVVAGVKSLVPYNYPIC